MILLIGFLAGILSGLAIGGGTLLVPALVIGMDVEQHLAQGIGLAFFLPASTVAVVTHYRQGNVRPRLAGFLASGSIVGALLGSYAAFQLDGLVLRRIFGFFLIAMGLYSLLVKGKEDDK